MMTIVTMVMMVMMVTMTTMGDDVLRTPQDETDVCSICGVAVDPDEMVYASNGSIRHEACEVIE